MIKLENIQKVFRTEEVETIALGGVSLELNRDQGATIVMVTHSERDAGYAQRIINLFDGQVVPEVRL